MLPARPPTRLGCRDLTHATRQRAPPSRKIACEAYPHTAERA
nr:MAG TPA: hypothetical protein [Caudoviricetes sp.]